MLIWIKLLFEFFRQKKCIFGEKMFRHFANTAHTVGPRWNLPRSPAWSCSDRTLLPATHQALLHVSLLGSVQLVRRPSALLSDVIWWKFTLNVFSQIVRSETPIVVREAKSESIFSCVEMILDHLCLNELFSEKWFYILWKIFWIVIPEFNF